MEMKEIFGKAFSGVRSAYSCPDHETALNDVLERAKKMDKKKRNTGGEEVPYSGETKKHGILPVIAGTAAVVAIIGAGIFGLGYMNSRGIEWTPLKEGASNNTGGSQPGVYTAVSSVAADNIDISELAGKVFRFSDCTVMIDYAEYDGQYIRVDYTQEFTGEVTQNAFFLEPQDVSRYANNRMIWFPYSDDEAREKKFSFVVECQQVPMDSCYFNPALARPSGMERVPDLVITATRDHAEYVRQPVWDDIDDTIAEGVGLSMFWASKDVLEANIHRDLRYPFDHLEVYAVAEDGEKYPLVSQFVSSYMYDTTDMGKLMEKNYFISEDPDIPPLCRMKGFEFNGKFFEMTEAPEIIRVSTDENGEVEIIGVAKSTQIVTTSFQTTMTEENIVDQTITDTPAAASEEITEDTLSEPDDLPQE